MRVRHVRLRILRCLYPLRVCSVCGKVSGGCRATHLRRVVGAGLPTTSTGSPERRLCPPTPFVVHAPQNRGVVVQRFEILVAVMLARERRRSPPDAASCAPLAAALAALPSRPLEMVAEALVALGCSDVPAVSRLSRERSSPACRVS